jgi:hypothetical protein
MTAELDVIRINSFKTLGFTCGMLVPGSSQDLGWSDSSPSNCMQRSRVSGGGVSGRPDMCWCEHVYASP